MQFIGESSVVDIPCSDAFQCSFSQIMSLADFATLTCILQIFTY